MHRLIHLAFAVAFVAGAALQWGDADRFSWLFIFGMGALVSVAAADKNPPPLLICITVFATCGWWLFQLLGSGVATSFLRNNGVSALFTATTGAEEAREFVGLLLCVIATIAALF